MDQTDKKVWELIKESVSLEKSFGDASISQKHCNFFVNKGNAKFTDMKNLIDFVSDSVFKKTVIKLETEIKILVITFILHSIHKFYFYFLHQAILLMVRSNSLLIYR